MNKDKIMTPSFDEISNGKKQYFEVDKENKTFKVIDIPEENNEIDELLKSDKAISYDEIINFIIIMKDYMQKHNITSSETIRKNNQFKHYLKINNNLNKYYLKFNDYYFLALNYLENNMENVNKIIEDRKVK